MQLWRHQCGAVCPVKGEGNRWCWSVELVPVLEGHGTTTKRVLPVLVDENIHYRILKLVYGAKSQRWNMPANRRHVPMIYSVWHAYTFVVTLTFRVF